MKTLSGRLLWLVLSVTVSMVLLMALGLMIERRSSLYQDVEDRGILFAESSASGLYNLFSDVYLESSSYLFEQFHKKFQKILDRNPDIVRVAFINRNGRMIFDSLFFQKHESGQLVKETIDLEVKDARLKENLKKNEISVRRVRYPSGNDFFTNQKYQKWLLDFPSCELLEIVVPKTDTFGDHLLSVCYWVSYEQAEKALLRAVLMIVVSSVVMILILTIFLRKIAVKMTQPLHQLAQTAQAVSFGNYSVRAELMGDHEVSVLAGAFNLMLDQLQKNIELLDSKVVERSEQLHASENRFRMLVTQSPGIFFIGKSQPGGTMDFLYVSPSSDSLLGLKSEEMCQDAQYFFKRLHPDDRRNFIRILSSAVREKKNWEQDFRFHHRNGQMIWLHGESAISKNTGTDLEWSGFLTDITRKKKAEEELLHLNYQLAVARDQALSASKAKSSFLANMSHELRTPLNAIIGYTEMMLEDADEQVSDPELNQLFEDIEKIHSSGKHLLGLINNILDLSKIEAGRMEIYIEEVKVERLVHEVLTSIEPLVKKNQNEVILDWPERTLIAHLDYIKTKQILFNLLSNACKFTKNGKILLKIQVTGNLDHEWISFCVEDNGIGMDDAQLGKIFNEFSQAHSQQAVYGGTGLGLTITKKFAEIMGGKIKVKSRLHQGTRFEVFLPKKVTGEVFEPARSSYEDILNYRKGKRILIIDDDESVRDILSRSLEKKGFEVRCAEDGEQGLQIFREFGPHLVLLDIMMPGSDGWSVLISLKSNPLYAAIPVVMMSVLNDTKLGYALGASDFILKPIDFETERLSALLKRHLLMGDPERFQVLVVEHDFGTRQLLRKAMNQDKVEFLEAGSAREAIDILENHHVSLIFVNLLLPDLDGFELIRWIKEREDWKEIPVVALTEKDLSLTDKMVLESRVNRVIQKGSKNQKELIHEIFDIIENNVI